MNVAGSFEDDKFSSSEFDNSEFGRSRRANRHVIRVGSDDACLTALSRVFRASGSICCELHEELPSRFSGTGRSGAFSRLGLPTGRGDRGSSHWVLLLSRAETRTPDEDHDQSILIESIELADDALRLNSSGRARSTLDDARQIALSRVFALRSGRGPRFECVEVVGRTAARSCIDVHRRCACGAARSCTELRLCRSFVHRRATTLRLWCRSFVHRRCGGVAPVLVVSSIDFAAP